MPVLNLQHFPIPIFLAGRYTDRGEVYYLPDASGEGRVVGHDLQLVPELAEIHADVRSCHGQVRAWYTITTVAILEIIRLRITNC
jgi:hypothetical protein